MIKPAFIIPYFGKFNNFFQLFLNSCGRNPEYTWLIFTDDKSEFVYPDNVIVYYRTFNEICNLIKQKVDKNAIITRPYKLCDYRACYGLIFEEYLGAYDFWGYCDVDMIFGRITHFIKPEMFEHYDKLFFLGHCTLVRNSDEINRIFIGEPEFVKTYTDEENHSFDEEFKGSINNIFQRKGKRILLTEYEANIYVKSNYFHITRYDFAQKKYVNIKLPNLFFIWDGEKLTGIWKEGRVYKEEEYMYVHFQSRRMKNFVTVEERYKIIPNTFEDIETGNYDKIKKRHFNLNYLKVRSRNLLIKINRKIKRR